MSKVYSMSSPLICDEEKRKNNLQEILYHEAELRFTLKEIYKEEEELISTAAEVVVTYANFCEKSTTVTRQKLDSARSQFYFLATIYDKANLKFIIMQAKGNRLNNTDFEKIYTEERQRFEFNKNIKNAVRTVQKTVDDNIMQLRRNVFINEQNISEDEEFKNDEGEHFHLSLNIDSRLVGYARMKISQKRAEVSRVVVPIDLRCKGYGRDLMVWCEKEALSKGCILIQLNSQKNAINFYKKVGYKTVGRFFKESGIKHKKMVKHLTTT